MSKLWKHEWRRRYNRPKPWRFHVDGLGTDWWLHDFGSHGMDG
jgi:hypothetical protein